MKIKFKMKVNDGWKAALDRYEGELKFNMQKTFQKVFGHASKKFFKRKNDKIVSDTSQLSNQIAGTDTSMNPKIKSQLEDIWRDAWEYQYELIQDKFSTTHPESKPTQWQIRKEEMIAKGEVAKHNRLPVQYADWGLMTGYLRKSVRDAFEGGSNHHVEIGNRMLQAGYKVDTRTYANNYPHRFIEYLKNLGAIESEREFFRIPEMEFDRISEQMGMILRKEFVSDIIDFLEDVKVEI